MKKGWQGKQTFPPAFFLFSPDAQHPAGGVPPPSPWPAVRAPNSQSYILLSSNGFLRGAVPQPTRKGSIVFLQKCVCVFLCFTGKLFV
ncbi:MAG: hypothetical protein IKJ51_00515, partial [Clostridia bacterium]|nr:hypothetical protein [Clostridia bacterium]